MPFDNGRDKFSPKSVSSRRSSRPSPFRHCKTGVCSVCGDFNATLECGDAVCDKFNEVVDARR